MTKKKIFFYKIFRIEKIDANEEELFSYLFLNLYLIIGKTLFLLFIFIFMWKKTVFRQTEIISKRNFEMV